MKFYLTGSGSENFVLNPTTGVVTLARALNYEAKSSYFLTVFVLDGTSRVSTNLNITVNDGNDSPIFINAPYTASVVENCAVGSTVYKVTATDEDSGNSLTYSLSGTNSGHFSIGSATGVLTTSQVLL